MEYVKVFVGLLADPLNHFFLMLFIIGVFRIKYNRKHIFAFIYLLTMSLPLSHLVMTSLWSYSDSYNADKKYSSAVLLLGVSNYKWHLLLGEQVKQGYCQFNQHAERVALTLRLLKNNKIDTLIIGRLKIEAFDESKCLSDFLIAQGINKNRVIIMNDVKRTLDEVIAVKQLSDHKNLGDLLLITSNNHMRRAYSMFKSQDIIIDTLSTNSSSFKITISDFFPSSMTLKKNKEFFYEVFSYMAYWLNGEL